MEFIVLFLLIVVLFVFLNIKSVNIWKKQKMIKNEHFLRGVWRYQRGNQNPLIEEQTTQWPEEKEKRTNNDLQNIHIELKME
jgi:predicted Holliday junction resolvase-like endonuclease